MSRREDPGLADHLRSVWRRKHLVALGLLAGLAFGLFALPKAGAAPQYRATVRIDVKPLASTLLEPTNGSGGQGPVTGSGAAPASPLQDMNVATTVVRELGTTRAARLSALASKQKAQWPAALAAAITPTAVPGSTQYDLAYTDRDPKLAALVAQRYADALVRKRNADDAALTKRALDGMRQERDQTAARINELSAQADREADPALHRSASTATSTQLQLAIDQWKAQTAAIGSVNQQLRLLGPRTAVLSAPAVSRANPSIGTPIYVAIGLLLGLVAGVGAALLVEAMRPKVVTLEDLERATQVEPIGAVPGAGFRSRRPLAVAVHPFGPAAEGYRKVAAELERRGLGDEIKVLAVVSPDHGEGRSTLTANLAYALARDERHVTVVSGDLRRPGVEPIFRINRKGGLAELLEGDDRDPVTLLWSATDRLLVMAAGASDRNPAQLLATARLGTVMASLREFKFLMLIDTPPARSLADALILADTADAVLLVARSGVSSMRSLRAVTEGLARADYRVVGAVLVDAARGVAGGRELRRPGRARHANTGPAPMAPAVGTGKASAAQWQYDESEVLGASPSADDEPA